MVEPREVEPPEVERLRVFEASWISNTPHPAPPAIEVRAEIRGPSGEKLSVPAFHDGGGIWKIRFLPTSEGTWSYRTISRKLDLNGRTGHVRCVPSKDAAAIGPLRVDPDDPAGFSFRDGPHPAFLGAVCTRLLLLDGGSPRTDRLDAFLDRLHTLGFNWVVFAANPGSEEDAGPGGAAPARGPWIRGAGGSFDFSRLDPAYWAHVDRVIERLQGRGMVAHIQLRGPRDAPAPPARSPEAWAYLRHVVARCQAYPNIAWDAGPVSRREGDQPHEVEIMLRTGEWDPYRHPRTICDDDPSYRSGAYDFLSFRAIRIRSAIVSVIDDARRARAWPIVAIGYATASAGIGSDDEVIPRTWQVALAGAIPVAAATEISWRILRPEALPSSWSKLGLVREALERAGPGLRPSPDLVRAGQAMCLARPGEAYLLLLQDERLVTVRFRGIEGRLRAIWLDPEAGDVRDAGPVEDGDRTFHRPKDFGRLGAVLCVGRDFVGPVGPAGTHPPGSGSKEEEKEEAGAPEGDVRRGLPDPNGG
ncbi:MAG: DUF5060 domain-containing protein [Planctomycetes bacterium]|nr:DUF5060 domain-containing protein [Planctomycetota bacterium]